jgi:hypothetical protein
MASDATFLVDEFLEALVAQLDKTQDALAFKAVNRPLTYAIRDFNLELKVFVDLDGEGNVRLRSSGPNEPGASTMTIAFTAITRPMIEENTISLAATRGPSLAEAGLTPVERKRLERLGVSNTAQLRKLGSNTGTSLVARLTEIPVDRLRTALQLGQPAVTDVRPVSPVTTAPPVQATPTPPQPPAHRTEQSLPGAVRWPLIRLAPDTSQVHVTGSGLVGEEGTPDVRLNGRPVATSEADWDRVMVPIPPDLTAGTLEVTLADGSTSRYELAREPATNGHQTASTWHAEDE